jgi:flagellar biogenesis protein FliO
VVSRCVISLIVLLAFIGIMALISWLARRFRSSRPSNRQ